MKVLIDGDILVYRCAFACEKRRHDVYLEERLVQSFRKKSDLMSWLDQGGQCTEILAYDEVEPVNNCFYSLNNSIEGIIDYLGSADIHIVLSGERNFRKQLYPDYKEGRKSRPKHYKAAREYLMNFWDAIVVEDIEADDWLGINQDQDSVIVTIDKDLDCIPGWHYNYVTQDMYFLDEDQAERNFWTQMLVGDRVDNIFGITGIGQVKAEKLISIFYTSQLQGFVLGCYLDEDGTDERYHKNYTLLRILQEEDEWKKFEH